MTEDTVHLWGDMLLPAILEALGESGDFDGVRLQFAYGQYAVATLIRDGYLNVDRLLPIFGIDSQEGIGKALGASRYINALTLFVRKGEIAMVECRYFPLQMKPDELVAALKSSEIEQETL